MKIPAIVPTALCVVAGLLLVGETFRQYFGGDKFDVFFFCVGLYFTGKGLFIHQLLSAISAFKQNR
jgi:hypothetical protein